MRYTWTIKTGDAWYAGTDSNVFLTLNGSENVMKEVEIADPNTLNDWEAGATNIGTIETAEDLGDIQTGQLRADHSGPGPGWQVDWVKVRNEEDGREWTAQVGAWSDQDGRNGRFRLKFALTDRGDYDRIQKQKQKEAEDKAAKEARDRKTKDEDARKQRDLDEEADFQRELDEQNKQLERELKKVRMETELAKKRAEIEKLKGGGQTPGMPPMGGGGSGMGMFRTYELFGILNGMNVPLAQVVVCDSATGRCSVVPGGRVIVGEQPNEGFGLAGFPGRWQMYYPGRSPVEFGLDPDKAVLGSDGVRGWVLNAQFLSQVFGSGWRAAIYA